MGIYWENKYPFKVFLSRLTAAQNLGFQFKISLAAKSE